MARTGLSKEDVKLASAQLKAQGRYPSVDAVRAALGDTGSKSTIHKYLKELESDAGTVSERQVRTARSLQSFSEELAAQLHAEADERIVALQAQHASVVAAMGAEITALQAKVHALEAAQRAAVLTHEPSFDKPHAGAPRPAGFGVFGNMVNNSRSGKQVWSKFSELFGSRSRTEDDTTPPAQRFTLPLHS